MKKLTFLIERPTSGFPNYRRSVTNKDSVTFHVQISFFNFFYCIVKKVDQRNVTGIGISIYSPCKR